MTRWQLAAAVAVPALLTALIGLTHPDHLNASTGEYWRNMHLVLIPIFPLIGLAPWLIARRAGLWWGRAGALFGYGFAIFYTSLDILAGVAGGALVAAGTPDVTGPVFAIARVLGSMGVVSLVAGCVVAGVAAFRVGGRTAIPGMVLAVAGAILLQFGHIYRGPGTLAMLLLAGGFVVLAFTVAKPLRNAPEVA